MTRAGDPVVGGLCTPTPPDIGHLLVEQEASKKEGASRPEDLARMENEIKAREKDFAVLDESYGRNVVDLTLARGLNPCQLLRPDTYGGGSTRNRGTRRATLQDPATRTQSYRSRRRSCGTTPRSCKSAV